MPRHGNLPRLLFQAMITVGLLAGALPVPAQSIPSPDGKVFRISPGPNATGEAIAAIIQARPGDTIRFGAGFFEMGTTLLLQDAENITIEGAGMNQTVLSFRNSDLPEGIFANNVRGLTVRDLTVADTPKGDGIKLKGVKFGTLDTVRAMWSSADFPVTAENYAAYMPTLADNCPEGYEDNPPFKVSPETGRYGIYPVQSEDIIVHNTEVIGASDAGIYVGQTTRARITDSRAAYNVMGFEIENTKGGEYRGNIAECNTGGYLVYDLDYLNQYGHRTIVTKNIIRRNNTDNFTHLGGFIAAVPRGSGLILLAYDQIEVYDNLIEDHDTASIIIVSYDLLGGTGDRRLDGYAEGIHIHDNIMRNAGSNPPTPNWDRVLGQGDAATALPTLVRAKNGGFGAHILWDGLLDDRNDCPYPVDNSGKPLPDEADADPAGPPGKPNYSGDDPNPDCVYNAYKFDAGGARKKPEWFICINPDTNRFENDNPAIPNYFNFAGQPEALAQALGREGPESFDNQQVPENSESERMGRAGANQAGQNLAAGTPPGRFVGDRDMSRHHCALPPLEEVPVARYTPGDSRDAYPDDATVLALCTGQDSPGNSAGRGNSGGQGNAGNAPGQVKKSSGGRINRAALAVNCPQLDHYNLFADPQDPRSTPNDGGVPFVLNSKLFSDYSTKYRVAFLPVNGDGSFEPARYQDSANNGVNATLHFPVGTVLAKSFVFTDEEAATEHVVETRLLIKRARSDGSVFWAGLPYIWFDEGGRRIARLALQGGAAQVAWDYHDVDSGERLTGSTDNYQVPHANQCINCHGNDDLESGAAPIGPKVRFLNRDYVAESLVAQELTEQGRAYTGNQLEHLAAQGLLAGLPEDTGSLERNAKYNVPGDSGRDGAADLEARVRSYLEVNCQHCHNPKGLASNSGLFLDIKRAVDQRYGICKTPTAAGGGTGGRLYDIVPRSAAGSILPFRMASNDPDGKMPPIARSVAHAEAVTLIEAWIDTVVDESYDNADQCGGGNSGGRLPLNAPASPPQ